MLDLDIYSVLNGVSLFILLLVFLFGAIEMLTNLWTDSLDCPKLVSKTAGWMMVVGLIDCIYWFMMIIHYQAHNEVFVKVGISLDILIYLSVFMIGEAILYPKTYTWKTVLGYYTLPVMLAILNPIICNTLFDLAFVAYGLLVIITMIIRHFKAKPQPWFKSIMIMVIVCMLNYLANCLLVTYHIKDTHTIMLLYTFADILTSLVWITIIHRLCHLNEVQQKQSNRTK